MSYIPFGSIKIDKSRQKKIVILSAALTSRSEVDAKSKDP